MPQLWEARQGLKACTCWPREKEQISQHGESPMSNLRVTIVSVAAFSRILGLNFLGGRLWTCRAEAIIGHVILLSEP